MQVKVFRKRISLSYLKDPSKPFDWHNNDANNALDVLEVYDDSGERAIVSAVQTVANMEGLSPGVHFYDTIIPGKFFLRYGVEPRAFRCQPLGIVGATTRNGDFVMGEVKACRTCQFLNRTSGKCEGYETPRDALPLGACSKFRLWSDLAHRQPITALEDQPAPEWLGVMPTDNDSTTVSNKSRWLEHDRKDHDGKDTRVAWSAGCIVHRDDADLEAINALCASSGIKPGDLIPCELFEEGES